MAELIEEPVPNWRYWFFSFADNLSLTNEDIERKKASAPKGTKLNKNKILGLRGKAKGLVFVNFNKLVHTKPRSFAKQFLTGNNPMNEKFITFTAGLDTSYSQISEDTIAMTFSGITNRGLKIVLDERVYNNAELDTPLAPSDTVSKFIDFLEYNRILWGFARNVFIDNADQATIMEFAKYKKNNGSIYNFNPAWKSKMLIIDRINAVLGWLKEGKYIILDHCTNLIDEFECYSWSEKDNVPEDKNDHFINSDQYSFIPYKDKIGENNGNC